MRKESRVIGRSIEGQENMKDEEERPIPAFYGHHDTKFYHGERSYGPSS